MFNLPAAFVTTIAGVILAAGPAPAQQEPEWTLLWPQGAPGAVGAEEIDRPALRVYLARTGEAPRAAVVLCPGGGYGHLALDHEGKQIADWLNGRGLTAVVLRYRLGPRYRHPAPLRDVQRAIRYVRQNASALGVQSSQIGVWGFSAGGHLASTAGTHFDSGDPSAGDPIDRQSSRPDFLILAYPVITMTEPHVHKGSRANLLGPNPEPALVAGLSNETRVTPQTPPTFLFHTTSDNGVPPENSIFFYLALRRAGVAAEMHVYERGRHGVGLAPSDPVLSTWADRLADWLKLRGLIR